MITYLQLNNRSVAGRLGNNLFEIASTIGIADSLNIPFYFPTWPYSRYFKHELPQKSYDELSSYKLKIFTEKQFNYDFISLDVRHSWSLCGYLQSWKYFVNSFDKIKYYFEPNFETNDNSKDLVSVHVRRGDYLDRKGFHTCLTETNYYQKAMALFPDDKFLIFSDDIHWCMQSDLFDNDRCIYKMNETSDTATPAPFDLLHMVYMAKCKHHIIANSSYSWWGSFLGNSNSITIAPRQWWVNNNSSDIYLPHWIQI
jgi:hypothetical protein